MNDQLQQYIPQQRSEKQKLFNCVPAEDETTMEIVSSRRAALRHASLSPGAKVLFCWLLDLAVSRNTGFGFGAVLISVTKLCELCNCSPRAIYSWKRQLILRGFVWISKYAMPNFWPMDVYHISALNPQGEISQMPTRDGMWGNGARRSLPEQIGMGARAPGQKALGLRGTKVHRTKEEGSGSNPTVLPEISPGSGTEAQLSAANNATESRIDCHGEPQALPLGAVKYAAGSGTNAHLPAAQSATALPNKGAVLIKPKAGVLSVTQSTHTVPSFEELDLKCALRLRPGIGEKMIERCKAKICGVEQSREPLPEGKAIITAYKQRIVAVKKWMAGEL